MTNAIKQQNLDTEQNFLKSQSNLSEAIERLVKDELRVDEILEPGLTMIRLSDLVQNCYQNKLPEMSTNFSYNIKLV